MATPISVYLPDDILKKLDAMVENQASKDRAEGLEGRQVTSRSKMISKLIRDFDHEEEELNVSTIEYHVSNLAKEYGAASVSLFGSFARGDQSPDSDVDILLDKGNIRGMRVLDFQEELANVLGRSVDVVTTAGASERFLNKIRGEAISLYEAASA